MPRLAPSLRFDYKLELGIVVGRPNDVGQCFAIADAEAPVFGLSLFND